MLTFFRTLKIKDLSIGLIKKLFENGFDTISKIYNMSIDDLMKLEGFKETSTKKIYNNIHEILDKPIELEKVMVASLKFGDGSNKRLKILISKYPKIMNMDTITFRNDL